MRLLERYIGVGAVILILSASTALWGGETWHRVKWVVDGDTIILKDGRHVRYIGIDCPEIDHENQRAQPFGYESRSLNHKLTDGQDLHLLFDRERFDRYGRTLAYVYRRDGLFVNGELLRQGYAYAMFRSPNDRKYKALLAAQRNAMKAGRGLWKHVSKEKLPVNGYVGNRRSKRFHTHDCQNANEISARNRITFENRWDAFWSGFAPAKGCIEFPSNKKK